MTANSQKSHILIVVVAVLSVACCSCAGTSVLPLPEANTEGLYGDVDAGDSLTIADTRWQELFADTFLQSLISEGIFNNADLQVAVMQVQVAEAYLSQMRSAFFPSLSLRGEETWMRHRRQSQDTSPREVWSAGLSAISTWEIDIWGKLGSAKKATLAGLLSDEAASRAVRARLVADIATAYYTLLALDAQLNIVHDNVGTAIDLVETMEALHASSRVTGAAIAQAEALRYQIEATAPTLKQQIRRTENIICMMVGRMPGPISRGTLASQQETAMLNTGIPALLLDNRPDVMQAAYNVAREYQLTRNARAYFYPALTLTASGGFESSRINELLNPANFAASIVGGLAGPILNRKENRTRLRVARIRQDEALVIFKNTLLNAGREVNDALSDYEAAGSTISMREQQLEALEKSVAYSKELLTYGSASYIEVLSAQQDLLSARLSSADDHLRKLTAVVSLYRALGGGWR